MKNIILGILLLVQLAVWFVVDPPWSDKKARTDLVDSKKLEAVASDQIGRIIIHPPGSETLTLEKISDQWTIREAKGYPATEEQVAKLLAQLEMVSKSSFRSPKATMHDTYEVSDTKGTRLTLETADAKPLDKFVIGKRDIQGVQGTFIRRDGEDDVYVTPAKEFASLLTIDPKRWYNPAMMDVDFRQQARISDLSSNCYRLEIESNVPNPEKPEEVSRKRYIYERVDSIVPGEEARWEVVEPSSQKGMVLNPLLMKGVVSGVLGTRAFDLVGPSLRPEYGLEDPDGMRLRVRARFKDAQEETVRTVEVGSEVPPTQAGKTSQFRYARSSYPGGGLRQRFVFAIAATTPNFFERDPATLELKEAKKQETPTPK